MKSVKVWAVAAALFAMAGMIDSADAQQPGTTQGQWGDSGNDTLMGPWMMGRNGMMPITGWNGKGASMCTMMTGHIEGRLAYLKTELKITEAQESLWNAYASAARDNAESMIAHCTSMMGQGGATTLSLPDRLDQHEQFMAAQLDALRAMDKTLKPLYATFSDPQKEAANQMIWGPMGMM